MVMDVQEIVFIRAVCFTDYMGCWQEKKAIKEEKMKLEEKYMWAVVDGVKEKVVSTLFTSLIE